MRALVEIGTAVLVASCDSSARARDVVPSRVRSFPIAPVHGHAALLLSAHLRLARDHVRLPCMSMELRSSANDVLANLDWLCDVTATGLVMDVANDERTLVWTEGRPGLWTGTTERESRTQLWTGCTYPWFQPRWAAGQRYVFFLECPMDFRTSWVSRLDTGVGTVDRVVEAPTGSLLGADPDERGETVCVTSVSERGTFTATVWRVRNAAVLLQLPGRGCAMSPSGRQLAVLTSAEMDTAAVCLTVVSLEPEARRMALRLPQFRSLDIEGLAWSAHEDSVWVAAGDLLLPFPVARGGRPVTEREAARCH